MSKHLDFRSVPFLPKLDVFFFKGLTTSENYTLYIIIYYPGS